MSGFANWMRLAGAGLALTTAVACTPIYRDHGYLPLQDELDSVQLGQDTRATVIEKLGRPSTGGMLDDSGIYYVKSRVRTFGPARPEVFEREVVAISFAPGGTVSNVERFGLEDGVVVPLTRRVTSSSVDNKDIVRQLLGNLGRFSATDFIDS